MKSKPITPYARLLQLAKEWAFMAKHRHTVIAFTIPKARLGEGWELASVANGSVAAKKLGYDTTMMVTPEGDLRISYSKELPDIPYEWQK